MEVDDSFLRSFADGFADDLTVCHDHGDVHVQGFEIRCDFLDLLRLPNRDAVREGEGFDFWRDSTALATTDRFIWLSDKDARLRAVFDEMSKRRDGDISGGDEGEGH